MNSYKLLLCILAISTPVGAADAQSVLINEIAWMGTTYQTSDEWIELHNPTAGPISLSGWTLAAVDGTPSISLGGQIDAAGYYLLERTDDGTVSEVTADRIFSGPLHNDGEILELRDSDHNLIDRVSAWYAGDHDSKATMSRAAGESPGDEPGSWFTSTELYSGGFGTPRAPNGDVVPPPSWFAVYFSGHLWAEMPGEGESGAMAEALIEAIDAATTSIDFALSGVEGRAEVADALVAAAGRGVAVRGVVDSYDEEPSACDDSRRFPYRGTARLLAALPPGTVVVDHDDRWMHNTFFVFDGNRVWTGSADISDPGLYREYDSSVAILVDHPELAAAYTAELEEMHAGSFHDDKRDDTRHVFQLADGTRVESYFSPTDDARGRAVVRAIDAAASTLDVRLSNFTDPVCRDALVAARQRGVAIRIILDAAGAAGEHSQHRALRDAGAAVKVESWGGRESMNALIADGDTVVFGSQSWTGAGHSANDENTLYVESPALAAAFTADFEQDWQTIPDVWLAGRPGAESADSPGSLSDFVDNDHDGDVDEGWPQSIHSVETGPGAINVYFNKSALESCGEIRPANHNVDLQERLLERIAAAQRTIDVATYELNLPPLVQALIDRAAVGVDVRVVADAKEPDEERQERYDLYHMHLERLRRGADGVVGTGDDAALLADSPIFAVEDAARRLAMGLPPTPESLPYVTAEIGSSRIVSGYLVADGEYKEISGGPAAGFYYAPQPQMHNKFVVLDETWVWTGSWNFTVTGLYGSEDNMAAGILGGNANHGIELHSPALAAIYTAELEEMWGSSTMQPDPAASNFHGRKRDNTAHHVTVGGRDVDVYFSPGREDPPDDLMPRVTQIVRDEADLSARFSVFAWAYQHLVDELKLKYEGSTQDQVGVPTGFAVEGVFDSSFWQQWWSASVEMLGCTVEGSENNPNVRWANRPPVFVDGENAGRRLHHKYMILDGQSDSEPVVITGSANWSSNADTVNDENLLVIHDAGIADQFQQEFAARYYQAGGPPCKEVDPALSVIKAGTGAGTVTSTPTGIDCGTDCFERFARGTRVTLAAAADAGSEFGGWSGAGCSGTGACVVDLEARVTVTATFDRSPTCGTLGLNGDRFCVDLEWRDFLGHTGHARAVPGVRSDDSGVLYFFSENNWEMLIKVLDGCGINDRFWVFSAATTNVEYTLTVTDARTGEWKRYFNPLGTSAAAITDTDALAVCGDGSSAGRAPAPSAPQRAGSRGKGECAPDSDTLCLGENRFRLEVEWRTVSGETGAGRVVPSIDAEDSGLFYFFDANNWEMLVKVLDGCGINGNYWVLAAATTDVGYTLTVTDTETGRVEQYSNPVGQAAPAIVDTSAFATCGSGS